MPGVNIWHPLWLPKLVVDDFEHRERQRLRESWVSDNGEYSEADSQYKPLWARDEEWGNDCLVTVQSSKWGEFLGVMEGCDRKFLTFTINTSTWSYVEVDMFFSQIGRFEEPGD